MLLLDTTALIITGCIAPNDNVSKLALTDASERYRQYVESIGWYLKNSQYKYIIFCDNSGFDVNKEFLEEAKSYGKELEWIAFRGDSEKVVEQGKGWGEGEILQYVLTNSTLIKKCSGFCKVTGRLIVKNVNSFIRKAKPNGIYFWTTGAQLRNRCDKIDTRFYCLPIEVYNSYFRDAYKNTNDDQGIYLEKVFFDAWKNSSISLQKTFWFPQFRGISGSMGCIYDESNSKIAVKCFLSFLGYYLPHK